jgi:hypothetical protein
VINDREYYIEPLSYQSPSLDKSYCNGTLLHEYRYYSRSRLQNPIWEFQLIGDLLFAPKECHVGIDVERDVHFYKLLWVLGMQIYSNYAVLVFDKIIFTLEMSEYEIRKVLHALWIIHLPPICLV